jgi:ABC-type branched-subunit amino acid transport system ATPase component
VSLALEIADDAAVLNHGRIVLRGIAQDLLDAPQTLERAYLGDVTNASA